MTATLSITISESEALIISGIRYLEMKDIRDQLLIRHTENPNLILSIEWQSEEFFPALLKLIHASLVIGFAEENVLIKKGNDAPLNLVEFTKENGGV